MTSWLFQYCCMASGINIYSFFSDTESPEVSHNLHFQKSICDIKDIWKRILDIRNADILLLDYNTFIRTNAEVKKK